MIKTVPEFAFDNSFARDMEGFYAPWQGAKTPDPHIKLFNTELALELGLDPQALNSAAGASILAGSIAPEGANPLAQVYAGHQFGGFSEQLGDGRALLLGEIIDQAGNRRDLHLKGSGRTPFSRGGDGKAALGPVLREYLMGEAMHALNIPTSRALSAVTTGENIYRDGRQPGAVLARVASSHLRVGTFQFFAARSEIEKVRQLANYAIARHYPQLAQSQTKYLDFLSEVIDQQAALVAAWMSVGFIHGVMNTDNVTISGETIDYGPCAFMDVYDPKTVFSSIDRGGRYAFGNQPQITQWNLARFAETLVPLIDATHEDNAIEQATQCLNEFPARYTEIWLKRMCRKIGLSNSESNDANLIVDVLSAMEGQQIDYTLFFRALGTAIEGNLEAVLNLFHDQTKMTLWLKAWQERLQRDPLSLPDRHNLMESVNPLYIPRNHLVEEALLAAWQEEDLAPIQKMLDVLSQPFTKRDGLEKYEQPAPENFGSYKTFCGT